MVFETINKIGKPLARYIKKKRRKKKEHISNKPEEILIEPADIKDNEGI